MGNSHSKVFEPLFGGNLPRKENPTPFKAPILETAPKKQPTPPPAPLPAPQVLQPIPPKGSMLDGVLAGVPRTKLLVLLVVVIAVIAICVYMYYEKDKKVKNSIGKLSKEVKMLKNLQRKRLMMKRKRI